MFDPCGPTSHRDPCDYGACGSKLSAAPRFPADRRSLLAMACPVGLAAFGTIDRVAALAAINVASVITRHASLTRPLALQSATIRQNMAWKISSPYRSRIEVKEEWSGTSSWGTVDRTSDRPDCNRCLDKGAARSEYRKDTPPIACESKLRDQSTAVRGDRRSTGQSAHERKINPAHDLPDEESDPWARTIRAKSQSRHKDQTSAFLAWVGPSS